MCDIHKLKLIGLTGFAGCGKDTVAAYIWETYSRVYTEAFADPLKTACSYAFGIPLESFYDREKKEKEHPFWNLSPRVIIQYVGTELFREAMYKLLPLTYTNFWVHRMAGRLNGDLIIPEAEGQGVYEEGDCVIITDVRFQNEYDFIVANDGIVMHIIRPGYEGKVGLSDHASERGINFTDPERTYHVDNSLDFRHLFMQVNEIIDKAKLRLTFNPPNTSVVTSLPNRGIGNRITADSL